MEYRNPMYSDEIDDLLCDDDITGDLVGVDWGDIGKKTLGGTHMAGKVLLSAFGAGAVAAPLDQIYQEHGLVPEWATRSLKVDKPDFVVLISTTNKQPLVVKMPSQVVVFGGERFDGNG